MLTVVIRLNAVVITLAFIFFSGSADELAAQRFRRIRSTPTSAVSNRPTDGFPSSRHTVHEGRMDFDSASLDTSIQAALRVQAAIWDNAESRSPWGVMHNALAWGATGEILIDGERKNSIVSLCENQRLKSVKMLKVSDGRLVPLEGPGLQGHPGQFLAVLAQNGISKEQPISVEEQSFTVCDLIECEKLSCSSDIELTFKLLGLVHYCGTDCQWTSSEGEAWSVEKLLEEELQQPINRVTCGGTHRLMAISLAVAKRKSEMRPMNGVWASAEAYVADYHEYAFTLFNPDGSFSTEWFERRAAASDLQKRLQTTGHVLEWLVVTVADDELNSSRMRKSVFYVSRLLQMNMGEPWSVGPRAHALRALRLYQERVEEQEAGATELAANAGVADDGESTDSR